MGYYYLLSNYYRRLTYVIAAFITKHPSEQVRGSFHDYSPSDLCSDVRDYVFTAVHTFVHIISL